jgi:EpsI family protein
MRDANRDAGSNGIYRWIPAGILSVGCLLLLSVQRQFVATLRGPLSTIQTTAPGYTPTDGTIDPEEQRVAGMSHYLYRVFDRPATNDAFSVYVGYYEQQTQGRTIHSPKNCMPGAGWDALSSERRTIATAAGPLTVNRYLLANKGARALVYYWYQGRGRTEASEYKVKWNLLRDAALRGRTEEALVRIVVPLTPTVGNADSLAASMAKQLVTEVREKLPV